MFSEDDEIVTGALAQRLCDRMEELEVSIKSFAEKIKTSYEHTRKIAKGETVPSRHLLPDIAEALGLNLLELEALANRDRARKKFPSVALGPKAANPELEPLENVWNDLSEDQRDDLILLAQRWSLRERKRKRHDQVVQSGLTP